MSIFIKAGLWLEKKTGYKGEFNLTRYVTDLITATSPAAPYKVYSALLTQSGDSNLVIYTAGTLEIGKTYEIYDLTGAASFDFTNVGAPNNNIGTYFVATGTIPNSWGINVGLKANTGAPVATVLENTIGDIWFTYSDVGSYLVNSNGLFTISKAFLLLTNPNVGNGVVATASYNDIDSIGIVFYDNASPYEVLNGVLSDTPIEIRVYN